MSLARRFESTTSAAIARNFSPRLRQRSGSLTDGDVATGRAFSRLRAQPATLAAEGLFRQRPSGAPGTQVRHTSVMRLAMDPDDNAAFFGQVACTDMQFVGEVAHLRSLGDGLFRTRHVIHRAIAAYEQSKRLLAQIELAESNRRRRQGLRNDSRRMPA